MSPAVGIVETVGKPSVFGEAFPSSEWESAFCADSHGCGSFHNASRDAFVFAKRGYDAQTESLDSGKALRNCSGDAPRKGIHRPNCPKPRVSDAVLHRSRGRFFEGGKAALEFDGEAAIRQRSQQEALERKIEELQTVIGEQVVEIRSLKKLSRT